MDHSHQHLHNKMANLVQRQEQGLSTEGGTVYSVVYVTAEPTFTGVIGGFTTLTDDSAASTTDTVPVEFSTAPTETVVGQGSASAPSTSTPATTTISRPTNFSNANTGADTNVAGAASTAGSSSASSGSSSEGMSTGAKVGIAVGVIGVIGLFAIFLLWLLGKKKKERKALANKDNEKSGHAAGAAASTPPTEMLNRSPTSATAPRLSLRPVSRMLPEFMAPSKGRLSNGNMLNTVGEAPTQNRNLSPSPQPRGPSPSRQAPQENPFADPQNPFADPEKTVQAPAPLSLPSNVTKPAPLLPMAATIVPAAAAVAAAPQTAQVESAESMHPAPPAPTPAPIVAPIMAQAPESTSRQPAPTDSAPATPVTPGPVVAGGPGPESSQGNVYRVMMDFKPSMEDELELGVGQLVRMLHEYDDGWVSLNGTRND